jgi:hypothetical protein
MGDILLRPKACNGEDRYQSKGDAAVTDKNGELAQVKVS